MGRSNLAFAFPLLAVLVLSACNLPSQPANPLQTAIALTLAAQPEANATPLPGASALIGSSDSEPSGQIVYTCQYSKRSGYNQICIINADGSGQRVLTSAGSDDDLFASVSSDGKSVLFASDRTGTYQIYELNLDSENLIQLTDLNGLHAYAPDVSPDGERIVFYARVAGGAYPGSHNIWVMNRDGTNPHAITALSGGAWDPAWSPDGQFVVFASQVGGLPQIFIVAADASDPQQVTDLDGVRGRSDWSPDGVTLATYIGTPWDREIYLFDLAGDNLRPITSGGNNLAPSFSPDGQWITFTSYRDNYRINLGCEIYIMRVDGSDIRRLTDNDICDWQPRWGP
ncbi:MAG: hypothetical protein DWG76_05255 [Chloroflexi bacterium]|nr:hypothetical protein [Chloroflexota bacterium]